MRKAYRFRLKVQPKEWGRLHNQLELSKNFYNELLQRIEDNYKKDKTTKVSKKTFNRIKREIFSEHSEYRKLYSQVADDISRRVLRAYQNFFRRVREGAKEKGFPRPKNYYKSITYPQNNGSFKIEKGRLKVSKIGTMKIYLHRQIDGSIKTMTIKRDRLNHFYATFSVEYDKPIPQEKREERAIGIDMGIHSLIAMSDGTTIENPKFLKESERRLAMYQKRMSRTQKGSVRRRRQRRKVAKIHQKIADQRNDFMDKLTTNLAKTYTTFAVENLQINNMLQNRNLAKSISDASWGIFIRKLSCKAESANLKVIGVPPRNTSRICSNCGIEKEMPLSERVYRCDSCHLEIDRDINASINILQRATTVGHTGSQARGGDIRPTGVVSNEPRTNPANAGEAHTL